MDLLEADIGREMTLELLREYVDGVERATQLRRVRSISTPARVQRAHRLVGGARSLASSVRTYLGGASTLPLPSPCAASGARRPSRGICGSHCLD